MNLEETCERPARYPRPWRVFHSDDGRVWVETADERRLIVCDIPGDMETIEGEELANADLLAAAPDLLRACEAALWPVRSASHNSPVCDCDPCRLVRQLEAAVARGTGKPLRSCPCCLRSLAPAEAELAAETGTCSLCGPGPEEGEEL